MKKLILLISILLFSATVWGGGIAINSLTPTYWWPLKSNLIDVNSSSSFTGSVSHAGTNRTYIDPDTGLITSIGANLPRFELVGNHRALLIEPAGTNLVPYSHEFDNAGWAKGRSTITANAVAGPDGSITADKLVQDATAANSHYILESIAKESFTDDTSITFSVYSKQAENTWMMLRIDNKAGSSFLSYFNLETGEVGTETVDSYGSESVRNGWYRYWITHDVGSGASDPYFYIYLAEGNSDNTIDGDSTSGIYLWGAQVEESPVPTSFIYTSGSSATRATESGEPHFLLPPGLFDDEGTAVIWWQPGYGYGDITGYSKGIVSCSNSGASLLTCEQGNLIYSYDENVATIKSGTGWSSDTWYKLAVKWGYSVDGTEKYRVGVDSGSGVVWGTEQDFDGEYTTGANLRLGYGLFSRMHLRDLRLYDKVLTDAEINSQGGSPE